MIAQKHRLLHQNNSKQTPMDPGLKRIRLELHTNSTERYSIRSYVVSIQITNV